MTDPKPFCSCSDVPASVVAIELAAAKPNFARVTTEPYCSCGAGAHAETVAPDLEPDPREEADLATSLQDSQAKESDAEEEGIADGPESSDAAESVVTTLHTEDGKFTLTNMRVFFSGTPSAKTVLASIPLTEVSSVRVDKLSRGTRGWIWVALGLAATIGTWQLLDAGGWIRLIFPGIVAAATVAVLAITLMSSPKLRFSILSRGGDRVEDQIPTDSFDDADEFSWNVLEAARDARNRARQRSTDPERRDHLGVEL